MQAARPLFPAQASIMGISFSLSVQSDPALTPNVNLTAHTSGPLASSASPSILSSVLFDNGKALGEPTLEVLKSFSNKGDQYTTIEVTTQSSTEPNLSKGFESEIEDITTSVQDGESKDEIIRTFRIQPRAEELYEEAVFDSYEAPAKDRTAIEQQYIPPSIEVPTDLSRATTPSAPAATDITPFEDHTTTKTSPDKEHTRGKPPQLTRTPTLVRIPHIPIQLFGRHHMHNDAELIE